ncbi:hypothetical protein WUBG_06166 [Wuchereria bancrofti]|uniref:DFDF domain-containing protein n=1 Tax=Wuchereria bancrofti TaxID=6293 RepID=J9EL47_WUCBA|nr:hypothetical protein WUBG_06166 [Wuchereria bancrofti]
MTDVGQVVTLYMRNGKCIQGRIKSVDSDNQIVLVERPFLDGKPMGGLERKFPISSILSFRILDVRAEIRNGKVISEGITAESINAFDNGATAEGIKARSAEHSMNIQKPLIELHAAGDCPSKVAKQLGSAQRVNFKKGSAKASTSTHKNIGITDTATVLAFSNAALHTNQQQSPCSSPSGSSCSSPITKAFSKLNCRPGTHISGGKRFPANCGEPKLLPYSAGLSHKARRNRGHSGILESDAIGQNNRDKKTNEDLIKPIDFDLNEDFDFEKNLEIFRNYLWGRTFSQKNYEHFENIISDPSRVTSWTTRTCDQFTAARFEKTVDGQRIPFLKPCDKEKFLQLVVLQNALKTDQTISFGYLCRLGVVISLFACTPIQSLQRAEPYLGSDIFHVMIADRLMLFIWNIIDR